MKKLLRLGLLLLLLAAAVLVVVPTSTSAQTASYPCLGAPADEPNGGLYPEPRIFLEAQSWWRTTPGESGVDQGHGHWGACVPAGQTLSAPFTSSWRLQLHDNPGYGKRMFQKVSTDAGDGPDVLQMSNSNPAVYSCAAGVTDCQFWITKTFDVCVNSPRNGWQAFKSRLEIREPDGFTMRPSVQFMARVSCSGKTTDDYSRALTDGYGWYTDAAYAYAKLHSYAPSYIPPGPVSGQWTLNLSFMPTTDGVSLNTTHYVIAVDPALHAVPPNPGTVFYDADTGCAPKVKTNCGIVKQNFTIDTTTLSNGLHKLFLRADALDPRGSTNSGILVMPFTVQN